MTSRKLLSLGLVIATGSLSACTMRCENPPVAAAPVATVPGTVYVQPVTPAYQDYTLQRR